MPDPLREPAPDVDPDDLLAALSRHWRIEGELSALHGERDRNFRVDTPGGRYLLKVHNPADTDTVLDMQDAALRHLRTVAPDLPVPAVVPTHDGRSWVALTGRDGRTSLAWVMTWLEGRHPRAGEMDPTQLREWGRTVARVGRALRGFVHPAAAQPILWDVRRLDRLRPWLPAVSIDQRPAVEAVLDRFEQRIGPALPRLRAQIVHNDLAPTNVLIGEDGSLTGITDFGDMTHTNLVCDLAVAVADLLSGRPEALHQARDVLAGYESVTPLEPDERSVLPDLVAARYAATVLITAWRTQEHGWAPPIGDDAARMLEALSDAGPQWWAYDERPLPYTRRSTAELVRARAGTFGKQELSYRTPLHLVSGEGVFLHTADGRRFLDAYNNVPVLGHSHPAVVEAIAAQLATLNTNSRYLQDAPVTLAERLLATVPDRFDRVLLVNSGSEANDLAWRIARHVTGASGGIATTWAYHGITAATVPFSPESWGDREPPDHMRLVDPPPAAGAVGEAARSLVEAGHKVAAMLVDGVFTSDGILGPAHGWTAAAASAVHDAGGLYVADEVQAGHGRTGTGLWSFVAGDVPADLVTLGKPLGNGYPVAAVIGPAELIDPFVTETDYFSTFGGSTAACAAALAVLRVIEEEQLVTHAADVGARLLAALRDATAGRPEVAQVRGWGLALAVDLVDPGTGRPDAGLTGSVIEGMRDRGVLIGRTGRHRSTLKIRPPLVFGEEHVHLLVDALAETLTDVSVRRPHAGRGGSL